MKTWSRLLPAFLFLFVSFTAISHAQTNNNNNPPAKIRYFSAKLPGGTYTVALSAITSVSSHTYIVDGTLQVTEATITDTSSAIARFYFVEPYQPPTPTSATQYTADRLKELTTGAANKLGMGETLTNVIVKNYPTTTHAKTIEYRLPSAEIVENLRKAAEDAFLTSTTKIFELK